MPIRDVVIFPYMMTPFVVGRESSVKALEEAMAGDKKIFLATQHDASSNARTLDSRPTTNGVIMYGKMTTSRMGIIGRRFVSDFSFEVSIVLPSGIGTTPVPRCAVCTEGYG